MESVEEFIKAIGRKEFAERSGVPQQSISRAIRENLMPASWYEDALALANERQAECPMALFRWLEKKRSA